MNRSTSRYVGALGVAAVLLAGCGGNAAATQAGGPGNDGGPPVEGGELTFSDVAGIASWQTQALGSYTSGNTLNSVLDRLTFFDKAQNKVVPWIASEFAQNSDATEFTFKIRPGVTFSDKTPLDAEAVKANFDLWGKGDESRQILPSRYVPDYDSSEVVGGDTVKVRLKAPNSSLLFATSAIFLGLVGKATLARNNTEAGRPENVVGSGPFVYESHVQDQQIVLRKRPDYKWAAATDDNQGPARLDKVTIKVLPEVGLRTGALQSKQVDVARGIQPLDEQLLRDSGYQVDAVKGVDLTANFAPIRIQNELVSDIRVRKALLIGFNRQQLVESVLTPSFPPPKSLLNATDKAFVDLSSQLGHDVAQAKRLLDEAGWTPGPDGVRQKDGKRLELTIPGAVQQPAVQPTWEFIEQQWRTDLGVALNVRSGDPAFATAANTDKNVPLAVTRTWLYAGLADVFTGKRATTLLHDDPDLVALRDRERRATDPAEYIKVVQEEQKLLIDKAYVIPTSDEAQLFARDPAVHVEFTSATYPDFQSAWKAR